MGELCRRQEAAGAETRLVRAWQARQREAGCRWAEREGECVGWEDEASEGQFGARC